MATKRSGAGLNSSQDISQLVTSVNAALAVVGASDKPVYTKIAFVDDGSQTEGSPVGKVVGMIDNGDGEPGEVVKYAFSPVANAPETWHFGKDRNEVDERIQYIELRRERHAPPDTLLYWDSQDVYGILSQKQGAIIERAGLIFDWLLARALNENGTCYDGKAFFATDHPVDPLDPAKGTFSNDISVTDLDATGLATALDTFAGIRWFDGKVRSSDTKPILVSGTKSLELKARQLVFGSLIPTTVGSNAVAASSPFEGLISDVVLFQALRTEAPTANSPKYVYLINPGTPVKAGLIVSPKRRPLFHVSGLSPEEEIRRKKGAISYGWDDFSGVGLGLPQDVLRVKVG